MTFFRMTGLAGLFVSVAMLPLAAQAQTYAQPGYPVQGGTTSQTQIDGSVPLQGTPQQTPQIPPQVRADTERAMQYPLPPDFMTRAAATIAELQARNIQPPNSHGTGLADTISRISQIPGLAPVLQSHGFTPESFVMGMTTFGMTLAASNGQLPAGMPSPNPANVALFKAQPEQVTALMQAMGNPPH
ncbi:MULTISPECIES: hypothetical protein [Gluconobacter]|uniref:Uncharacterized protein n=1 Tax=Gluconobacter albidus TaxID=318683 RepID=A0A149THL2_9PROT|nr:MULTISPECIES: hypothetical protein [Gluconobacter]KXV38474.1 hypothetical protein AD941_05965 [Gluconobacter albidus]KXV47302.1 hypothetical protein AD945_11810 [Gluconobacter albidus]MBS1028067.1 hypothetical protein [Gluconobacter albidus]MCP1273826.1 hypothetical protein [Gluconobacter albidus]GBQ93418.1 hypothetical protein AA3250_2836 [Gluconobacter albidus NBRC 3250]